MADVRQQVILTLATGFENYTSFPPATTCPPLPPSWTRSWPGAPPSPRSAARHRNHRPLTRHAAGDHRTTPIRRPPVYRPG